jgi:hypothetical protein
MIAFFHSGRYQPAQPHVDGLIDLSPLPRFLSVFSSSIIISLYASLSWVSYTFLQWRALRPCGTSLLLFQVGQLFTKIHLRYVRQHLGWISYYFTLRIMWPILAQLESFQVLHGSEQARCIYPASFSPWSASNRPWIAFYTV